MTMHAVLKFKGHASLSESGGRGRDGRSRRRSCLLYRFSDNLDPTSRLYLPGVLSVIIIVTNPAPARSQVEQNPLSQAPQVSAAVQAAQPNRRYRIGAGDVLDIRILNRPQLSRESVRVEGDGMIRMPLIDGEIQAACKRKPPSSAYLA